MIISLRGTNASGKTMAVRGVLAQFTPQPIYGCLGPRKPEAYRCARDGAQPIYVLGPYDGSPSSGLDRVTTQGFAYVIEMIERYRTKGHVLMEGILLSHNFGSVGAYLVQHKDEVIVAILDTSLEQCLVNLQERRTKAGNVRSVAKHVESHYKRIHGSTRRMFEEGGVRIEMVSRENAAERILSWLN